MAIDPICGMTVDEATGLRAERDGKTYYFCCDHCRRKFLQGGVGPTAGHPPPAPPGVPVVYICPMCPAVRSDRPGACPKCGMALEPELVTGAAEDDTELQDMTRRLVVAGLGSVPVFLLAMLPMLNVHLPLGRFGGWCQLILTSLVVIGAWWPLLVRGFRSLVTWNLNMFTLIGLGTSAAYLFSVVAVVAPRWIPSSFYEHVVAPLHFESAAVITTLVLLGQVLELRSRRRTGDAIRQLLALAPPQARVVREEREIEIPLDEVRVGDVVRVRPGEKVPVDGIVVDGQSRVSEALVTGEPIPVAKSPGDKVIGGTLNESGSFTFQAQHVGRDTVLARIVDLVAQAQRSRAPIQRVADAVAAWFVPTVVVAAVITFVAWALLGREDPLASALVNAVSVLIIACPCALGLATPMSIMVGVGRGAQQGVLIRSAEVLERLAQVDTIVFDKTGTLTAGRPAVVDVRSAAATDRTAVLRWAAAVEQHSEHPLARAIVAAAREGEKEMPAVVDFQATSGQGVSGQVESHMVRVGTWKFVTTRQRPKAAVGLVQLALGPPPASVETQTAQSPAGGGDSLEVTAPLDAAWQPVVERSQSEGKTVVFVSVDGQPVGLIAIADPIKPNAAEAVDALRAENRRLVMLTGDNPVTASAVARQLAITDVRAGLLPQDKIAAVRQLRSEGRVVAMVGDGVNDAPALAAADVGIAMSTGSDVAIESAGVTLLRGDLGGVVRTIRLSQAVVRNIHQNLFFAFLYNVLGIPLAAGILAPLWGITLNPMIAAAAMSFSSVSVISNALRLRRL